MVFSLHHCPLSHGTIASSQIVSCKSLLDVVVVVVAAAAAVRSPDYCPVSMNFGKTLVPPAYPLNLKGKKYFCSLAKKQINLCQASCLAQFLNVASSILDSQLLSVYGMTSDDEAPLVPPTLLFQVTHISRN